MNTLFFEIYTLFSEQNLDKYLGRGGPAPLHRATVDRKNENKEQSRLRQT